MRITPLKYLLIIGSLLLPALATAQTLHNQEHEKDPEKPYLQFRSSLLTSTGNSLPFWMHTNRDGRFDQAGNNALNEIQFRNRLYDSNTLTLDAEINAVYRYSENQSMHFSEAYLKAEAFGFRLSGGRYTQPVGLNNHDLSIGSMMVSRNATPIPSVSFETIDYQNVPGLNGYVQYNAKYAHGWFEENRYMRDALLHQKYLYLRLNYKSISAIGGIIHNAQWGGFETVKDRQAPQSFRDYMRVVFAQSAREGSDSNLGEFLNKAGNSVAAYEFGLLLTRYNYKVSLTRLFYHEDTVSHRFRNPWDGVWGFNLTFNDRQKLLSGFTYEHINTKNQSARSFELIGRRNYYGHFLYKNGWTYEGRTVGIPLILLEGVQTVNNVLVGHHLGFEGKLSRVLQYKLLATYSRNYGIQDDWVDEPDESIPNNREDIVPLREFRTDQYSWLAAFQYNPTQLNRLSLSLELIGDNGSLYERQVGVLIGVGYRVL